MANYRAHTLGDTNKETATWVRVDQLDLCSNRDADNGVQFIVRKGLTSQIIATLDNTGSLRLARLGVDEARELGLTVIQTDDGDNVIHVRNP